MTLKVAPQIQTFQSLNLVFDEEPDYVVVFGAYVALSAWLPKYYVSVYNLPLAKAALLTTPFIFASSLLRPFGGWLSDRYPGGKVLAGLLLFSGAWTFLIRTPEMVEAGLRAILRNAFGDAVQQIGLSRPQGLLGPEDDAQPRADGRFFCFHLREFSCPAHYTPGSPDGNIPHAPRAE